MIDPTPSSKSIDPTQSLIDPTSVILVYFHRLHCSSDPIPTVLVICAEDVMLFDTAYADGTPADVEKMIEPALGV